MIEFIKGKIVSKNPSFVILDTPGGIGYRVNITINTYNNLPEINCKTKILTYFNVTEKSQDLYGFYEKMEKELFEMLISVSGIGPKIAINLLSFVKPNDFKRRLISGEVELLTSLPGIGPKTAKRIIIELKDKFIKSDKNDLPIENNFEDHSDALNALINLGYKRSEVITILNKISNEDSNVSTEQKIKIALQYLK